jgi:hypothetical protein
MHFMCAGESLGSGRQSRSVVSSIIELVCNTASAPIILGSLRKIELARAKNADRSKKAGVPFGERAAPPMPGCRGAL